MRSIAVAATLGVVASAWADGPTFEEFRTTVQGVAGAGATDCGQIPFRETDHRIIDCARDAVSRKQPFWIIAKRQGIDSEVFLGIAQSKGGELWAVTWDSDIGGGSRRGSSMSKTRCSRIEFEARLYANDVIQCASK
jgi:hypothetical protein